MAESMSTPSLFVSLAARPPTPPRDAEGDIDVDDALRFLEHGHDDSNGINNDAEPIILESTAATTAELLPTRPSAIDTPPSKATTVAGAGVVAGSPPQRGSASTKKVDFSPWPVYHKIPHIGQSSSPVTQNHGPQFRPSPLAQHGKPLKSILKSAVTTDDLPPTPDEMNLNASYFSPGDPGNFRKMLQSVLQQLEGSSRDARRDAYIAINNYIKACAFAQSDLHVLDEKMDRLVQFLTRDMAWKDSVGALDGKLVVPASLLTCAFIFDSRIQAMLDDDFRAFVVERSMFVLEQTDMPKAIVRAHLQILCVQRFPSSIVTPARTEKLLAILHTLEDRPSIAAAKLIIFQRLVETAPSTMLSKMSEWIEHLFHGALSSNSDVQRRAIDAFTQVGMILGTSQPAAKAIHEVCEREMEEGQSFGDYFNMQLNQMTADKERAPLVPEIWTAVVLCFRTRRRPVTVWPKFKNWLLTLQKCLNSSDMAVKRPANIAWNKLVFTVNPDSSTTDTMRSMLKVPIVAGLEKRGNNEQAQQLRQLALDSYCNLLHYGLRPDLSFEELDVAWDMYVGTVLPNISKNSTKGRHTACRVLHGLLKKTSGTWNKKAAIEPEPIRPDELPRLDVRWVRSRIGKFIQVIEPLVASTMLMPFESNRAIDGSWRLLMRAVAEAGSQEVRTSNELKEAIAQVTNFFRRLWTAAATLSPGAHVPVWIARYQSLLEITVDGMGSSHFVEEILARTSTDEVEAAPTPSHRVSKHQTPTCSPFVVLFALYHRPFPAMLGFDIVKTSAVWFLRLLGIAKGSTSGILGSLQKCLQYCSSFRDSSLLGIQAELWAAIAETSRGALHTQALLSPQRDTFVAGNALKSAISILAHGTQYFDVSSECSGKAIELYSAACEYAKHIAAEGGVALGVMEPFAESLKERLQDLPLTTLLALVAAILSQSAWPKTRAELDRSRKALWSVTLEVPRPLVFDPFEAVYLLILSVLERSYKDVAICDTSVHDSIADAAFAAVEFLQKSPSATLPVALRKLSNGFAIWIEDKQRTVFPDSTTVPEEWQAMQTRVCQLWAMLLRLIQDRFAQKDSRALDSLEPLLLAGFLSPSKPIVNSMITFWNSTFAKEEHLAYPPRLFPVLRARQVQTDLDLPGFTKPLSKHEAVRLPAFADSQLSVPTRGVRAGSQPETPVASKLAKQQNIYIRQHLAAQGLSHVDTDSSKASPLAARPRHNDSQVDFAPIEAPSRESEAESQHFTEHQKEVRTRQQQDAVLYPDLSSSPLESIRGDVLKKLDFMAKEAQESGDRTPNTPIESHAMNDDLPSSPTPRASAMTTLAEHSNDLDDRDADSSSIRSGSPQLATVDIVSDSHSAGEDMAHSNNAYEGDLQHYDTTVMDAEAEQTEDGGGEPLSEPVSDPSLPNAQLEREQQAAEDREDDPLPSSEAASLPNAETRQPATPSKFDSQRDSVSSQGDEHHHVTPSDAGTVDSRSSRVSKKRKRYSETVFTARKKALQSPFNRFMAKIFSQGRSQEELDEIIVAPHPVSSQDKDDDSTMIASHNEPEEQIEPVEDLEETRRTKPLKRRPGRPKKSESQSQAQESLASSSANTRGVKRRASTRSLASSQDKGTTESPARTETKRLRSAFVSTTASHAARRGRPKGRATRSQDDEDDGSVEAHSRRHSIEEDSQPSQSILSQLKGILASARSMILGAKEEEREYDDVLFEIRREVFEAGKRRDQMGG